MLKIGLLEDEEDQAQRLVGFLSRYHSEHEEFAFEVLKYENARALLDHYEHDYDLLFLDIRLPDMTGMEAAHHIREKDRSVMIIFVTNLTQYAIEGYSVQAFDYIVKPVQYAAFAAKLERVLRVLSYREADVVLDIRMREGSVRLTSDMIQYLEVYDHDLLIHTDTGVLRQWGSLSQYEKQLAGAHFARCNNCYLVNLKYVRGVYGDEVQVGEERLPVSKSRRRSFLQALAQYKD